MAPAPPDLNTLSLHDALPIYLEAINAIRRDLAAGSTVRLVGLSGVGKTRLAQALFDPRIETDRSEEHTSELQSRRDLVCRLLLEKKKTGPEPSLRAQGPARLS